VNLFASSNLILPRGPIYLYENIRDFTIAVDKGAPVYCLTETREQLHFIAACGSLHVLWEDVAEIRALAVHPGYSDLRLDTGIVDFMINESTELGIKHVVLFSLTEAPFTDLGFKVKTRSELPPKAWGECIRCPKYFRCDEMALVLDL
jgi:amino-acid N-acetyltransferase